LCEGCGRRLTGVESNGDKIREQIMLNLDKLQIDKKSLVEVLT
jgi:hypothetical protein